MRVRDGPARAALAGRYSPCSPTTAAPGPLAVGRCISQDLDWSAPCHRGTTHGWSGRPVATGARWGASGSLGLVVQQRRTPPCHGGGRRFESGQGRQGVGATSRRTPTAALPRGRRGAATATRGCRDRDPLAPHRKPSLMPSRWVPPGRRRDGGESGQKPEQADQSQGSVAPCGAPHEPTFTHEPTSLRAQWREPRRAGGGQQTDRRLGR